MDLVPLSEPVDAVLDGKIEDAKISLELLSAIQFRTGAYGVRMLDRSSRPVPGSSLDQTSRKCFW